MSLWLTENKESETVIYTQLNERVTFYTDLLITTYHIYSTTLKMKLIYTVHLN